MNRALSSAAILVIAKQESKAFVSFVERNRSSQCSGGCKRMAETGFYRNILIACHKTSHLAGQFYDHSTQQMTPPATKCPETMDTIIGRLTTQDHLPQ